MKTLEYIGYETRGIDSYCYPIVRIDGEEIGVHCVRSWDVVNNKNLKHVVYDLSDIILQRFDDESNYGLSFYACGYNGPAQTNFEQFYWDSYGIELF